MSEDTKVARTQDEILDRISEVGPDDPFGWSRELLLTFLAFEHVRPYLKDGVTEDEWERRTDPIADLVEYLPFAWSKADGERGISAARSVDKIEQWLWLAGEDELLARFTATAYPMYGRAQLRVVTEALAPDLMAEREADG